MTLHETNQFPSRHCFRISGRLPVPHITGVTATQGVGDGNARAGRRAFGVWPRWNNAHATKRSRRSEQGRLRLKAYPGARSVSF